MRVTAKSIDDREMSFTDHPEFKYLADLKELDGWLWEFIRRNKDYRDAHRKLKKIINGKLSIAKIDQAHEILEKVENDFHVKPKGIWEQNTKLTALYDAWIPDPAYRYDQIPEEEKPLILRPYKLVSFSHKDLTKKSACLNDAFLKTARKSPDGLIAYAIRHLLAPDQPEHTIYIGISRRADKASVRKAIDAIIIEKVEGKSKKGPRMLPKHWKNCIQTFDHKEDGCTTATLAARLQKEKARSNNTLQSVKNLVKDYNKQAKQLINEDFRRYLD